MPSHAYFAGIRATISQELAQAQNSIQVAVAWITDETLFNLLVEKARASVGVTVIVRNDVLNVHPAGLHWQQLIDAGGALFFAPASPALHHKFCLLDGKRLVTGSYNWTYAAQRNEENIVVSDETGLVTGFRQAFSRLLDQAREVENVAAAVLASPPVEDTSLHTLSAMEITYRQEMNTINAALNSYEELVLGASSAYLQKDYALAESHLLKALALNHPSSGDAYQLLAGVYWRTEQFAESIAMGRKAEAAGQQDAALWNTLGLASAGLKEYKQAIGYYDRSIKAEPTYATWYLNKCLALDGWGRESLGDQVASEARTVASTEIKQFASGGNDHRLLRAYIERAFLRSDLPERRKDALAAREVLDRLPVQERDMHDLDDIKVNLK